MNFSYDIETKTLSILNDNEIIFSFNRNTKLKYNDVAFSNLKIVVTNNTPEGQEFTNYIKDGSLSIVLNRNPDFEFDTVVCEFDDAGYSKSCKLYFRDHPENIEDAILIIQKTFKPSLEYKKYEQLIANNDIQILLANKNCGVSFVYFIL